MLSPGVSFANNQLRYISGTDPAASPADFEAGWHGRFNTGALITGKKIFCLGYIMNADNGTTSAGIVTSAIIT